MPRPGTTMVDPRMLPAIAGVAALAATATGQLHRPSTAAPVMDPVTLALTPAAPAVIYDGLARVQPRQQRLNVVQAGEQAVDLHIVNVDVPAAVDAHVGDVWVTTASTDPYLIGRRITVMDVEHSSLIAGRRLVCQDQLG